MGSSSVVLPASPKQGGNQHTAAVPDETVECLWLSAVCTACARLVSLCSSTSILAVADSIQKDGTPVLALGAWGTFTLGIGQLGSAMHCNQRKVTWMTEKARAILERLCSRLWSQMNDCWCPTDASVSPIIALGG